MITRGGSKDRVDFRFKYRTNQLRVNKIHTIALLRVSSGYRMISYGDRCVITGETLMEFQVRETVKIFRNNAKNNKGKCIELNSSMKAVFRFPLLTSLRPGSHFRLSQIIVFSLASFLFST